MVFSSSEVSFPGGPRAFVHAPLCLHSAGLQSLQSLTPPQGPFPAPLPRRRPLPGSATPPRSSSPVSSPRSPRTRLRRAARLLTRTLGAGNTYERQQGPRECPSPRTNTETAPTRDATTQAPGKMQTEVPPRPGPAARTGGAHRPPGPPQSALPAGPSHADPQLPGS